MSVFSKVFIIVNLLLTLLLLAAMGRKIDYSFDGTYKKDYKRQTDECIKVTQDLATFRTERNAQVVALRADKTVHAERVGGIENTHRERQQTLDKIKQDITDKTNSKNTLTSNVQAMQTECQNLNRDEKNAQDELKKLNAEYEETVITLKRTINSAHATKRQREDFEAAVDSK